MYISGINSTYNYPTALQKSITQNRMSYAPVNKNSDRAVSPAFTGLNIMNRLFPPIRKFKNFSISEYSKLSKSELKYLREEYSKIIPEEDKNFMNNIEVLHDRITDILKRDYDEKYGEGKYVVIPVGRSVSSICKVLGYKIGETNVRRLPMSCTQIYNNDHSLTSALQSPKLKNFVFYLEGLGLSDDHLTFSQKKYILLDFCITGKSLTGVEKLFSKIIDNQDKLVYEDVMTHIKDPQTKQYTFDYLLGEDFKFLSFVRKSKRMENPFDCLINPATARKKTKLTWFKLLDNHMTGANYKDKPLKRDITRAGTL